VSAKKPPTDNVNHANHTNANHASHTFKSDQILPPDDPKSCSHKYLVRNYIQGDKSSAQRCPSRQRDRPANSHSSSRPAQRKPPEIDLSGNELSRGSSKTGGTVKDHRAQCDHLRTTLVAALRTTLVAAEPDLRVTRRVARRLLTQSPPQISGVLPEIQPLNCRHASAVVHRQTLTIDRKPRCRWGCTFGKTAFLAQPGSRASQRCDRANCMRPGSTHTGSRKW